MYEDLTRIVAEVHNGVAPTPMGPVPTALPDGTAVEVLIRPEALRLLGTAASTATPLPVLAHVEGARWLGHTSLVHLSVPNGRGGTVHLHARIPGQFLPPPENLVGLTLDLHQTLVFEPDRVRS